MLPDTAHTEPGARPVRATCLLLLLASAVLCVPAANAAGEQPVCATSAEDAALRFVELSVANARSSTDLLRERSLHQFRSRLEQLVDDRYSPASAQFRDRFLGSEWTAERRARASDAELVGQFLGAGEEQRKGWRVSEATVIESKRSPVSGRDVTVSYRIETPAGSSLQKRDFSAYPAESGTCWQIDVPVEAWLRMNQLAEIFKKSRPEASVPRQGPSRVQLQVVPASATPRPGMKEVPRRGEFSNVWVESTPLLTDRHVVSAIAAWDCEAGLGPEEASVRLTFSAEGGDVLREWTERNIGSMLAVAVDGRVVVFARVAAAVGSKLSMCMPGASLDEAEALASALLGIQK